MVGESIVIEGGGDGSKVGATVTGESEGPTFGEVVVRTATGAFVTKKGAPVDVRGLSVGKSVNVIGLFVVEEGFIVGLVITVGVGKSVNNTGANVLRRDGAPVVATLVGA